MRIALISDIHANIVALDAVLADCDTRTIDRIICLGDVATMGPQPAAVIDRLMEHSILSVRGNGDDWMLNPPRRETQTKGGMVDRWCVDQLNDTHREFLATMPPVSLVNIAPDVRLLCFHGTPTNTSEYLYPTTPETQLAEWLLDYHPGLVACGHTHMQFVRPFQHIQIINPGSVGQPRVRPAAGGMYHPAYAEYAIVDWRDGDTTVVMRRVPLPIADIVQSATDALMPHADWWAAAWREV